MKEQFKSIHGNIFATPQWLFDTLNKEFNFAVDLACNEDNKKCPIGLTERVDSLTVPWHRLSVGRWQWLNPPYSPIKPWIEKAQDEFQMGAKIVVLMPPIISTRYFSRVPPSEIRFIRGRIPFEKDGVAMKSNTQDSCLVIYGPPAISKISYVDREDFK